MWKYLWAAPTTLIGLIAGLLTLATGGSAQVVEGCIEFQGGFGKWFLNWRKAAAITFGHVILGVDAQQLDRCRRHEHVHVWQTERWGIAFLPAYGLAALRAKLQGGHHYFDNCFEVQARRGV